MWSLSKPTIQPEIPRLRTEIDEDRKKKKHCNELHLGNVISCYKYGERHAKHRYDTAWMCEKRCEQIAADSPIYQTLTSQLLNQSRLLGPWCNINNQNVNSVQLYCEYVASGHIAMRIKVPSRCVILKIENLPPSASQRDTKMLQYTQLQRPCPTQNKIKRQKPVSVGIFPEQSRDV